MHCVCMHTLHMLGCICMAAYAWLHAWHVHVHVHCHTPHGGDVLPTHCPHTACTRHTHCICTAWRRPFPLQGVRMVVVGGPGVPLGEYTGPTGLSRFCEAGARCFIHSCRRGAARPRRAFRRRAAADHARSAAVPLLGAPRHLRHREQPAHHRGSSSEE